MGLREFSMSPVGLLEIKKVLRSFSVEETELMINKMLTFDTAENIESYVKKHYLSRISSLIGRPSV